MMHQRLRSRQALPTIWTRSFLFIFIINLVINMAQFMMNTLVPKLADALGASAVVIGVVSGMFAVTALAVRPVVGQATIRIRKNHLLAATLAVILLAFVLYSFANSIEMVMAARLLHGAGMGFLAPVMLALASDALPEQRMASGIGIFSLGQAVATALGPSIGLALLAAVGYQTTFLLGAAILAGAMVLGFRVKTTPRVRSNGRRFTWKSFIAPEAIVPAVVLFFLAGAYSGVNSFIVLYGESLGVVDIGLFFTAFAIFVLLSRPIAGALADRHGLSTVIIPGMIIFAGAFVLISRAQTLTQFMVAGAVSAFGYGVCQPALQTLAILSVDQSQRGVAGNTNYIGVDLGYLVMPMLAGMVVSGSLANGASLPESYSYMYLALLIPVALGLMIYIVFGRRTAIKARPEPVIQ